MKYISFLVACVCLNLILLSNATAQSIALKGNLSYSTISEVEASFITPGISLEGRAGGHFTIGADVGFGSNDNFKMVHFTPSLKYYFSSSLRGFYLGTALDAFRLKTKNGGPVGYPFDKESESSGIAAGLMAMIGAQSIIDGALVLGIQIGPGYMPGIDAGFLHGTFYAGIAF